MTIERQHRIFVVIVALACLPAFVSAEMHYSPNLESCEIVGDADLYGPGVRCGFYLNWAAMCLAITLVPDHAILTFISINWLNLSTFICFFVNMFQRGVDKGFYIIESEIMVFETLVLNIFIVGAAFWIIGSVERFRPILCFLTFMYSLILFAIAYIAAAGQLLEQRKECLALFRHVDKAMQISMAVIVALCGLICLGTCLWNLWKTFRYNRPSHSQAHKHKDDQDLWLKLGDWESRISPTKALLLIIIIATGIAAIVSLEGDLKQYEISTAEASFTSTSQLNPFLLGLFNLLYVLWRSYERGVAAWPLTFWWHEIQIWIGFLMHRSKISCQSVCMRLSKSKRSSWDLPTP